VKSRIGEQSVFPRDIPAVPHGENFLNHFIQFIILKLNVQLTHLLLQLYEQQTVSYITIFNITSKTQKHNHSTYHDYNQELQEADAAVQQALACGYVQK
jgi:hypothetical protein